jgi:Cof subfamily protein (haloacid dehalogenase superfamily)
MLKYSLLAADLDGTLIGDDMRLSPRLKAAVREAQRLGVQVTIATGRTPRPILNFAAELDIHVPLICCQGGLVIDVWTGEVLHRVALPLPLLQETVDFARKRGLSLQVSDGEEIYVDRSMPVASDYQGVARAPLREVSNLIADLKHPPLKTLIWADAEQVPQLIADLSQHFNGRLQIVRTHSRIVEGIPQGVSKGRALAFLARHLGISREATVAIGDQDNDIDMVAWAGLGIAMGNGSPAVKQAADVIAPPVTDDGAAEAIERYVLGIPPKHRPER